MLENIVIIALITIVVVLVYGWVRPFTPFSKADYRRACNKRMKKGYFVL